jgi:hypothetical protein
MQRYRVVFQPRSGHRQSRGAQFETFASLENFLANFEPSLSAFEIRVQIPSGVAASKVLYLKNLGFIVEIN